MHAASKEGYTFVGPEEEWDGEWWWSLDAPKIGWTVRLPDVDGPELEYVPEIIATISSADLPYIK